MLTTRVAFALALSLLLCVFAPLVSARSCAHGEVATPNEVVRQYAHEGVPKGKIACRVSGQPVVVPAISHEAASDDPPCGADIAVHTSALGPYKEAVAQAGNAALSSDNPYGVAAGVVIKIVIAIDPQVAHNSTANCGIASVTLPKTKVPFHHYVGMQYDSHMANVYPIDQDSFDRPGAGEPFQKASWLKPVRRKDGQVVYGALYKNWATESGNYRHVRLFLDVFE